MGEAEAEKEKRAAKLWQTARSLLLGTVTLPGWAAIILAIIIDVPDWKSRYEFWLSVAQSTGGYISVLAHVLANPYFPGALAVAGVIYLVVVGAPGVSQLRHRWLPLAAWGAIALCASAIIVTAGYGVMEMHIRTEIAKGIAGVPRNTLDENNPTRPQTPLTANKDRNPTPEQSRILLQVFPKLRPENGRILFSHAPMDNEAYIVWTAYRDLLSKSGISSVIVDQLPRGTDEEGLMIEVRDTSKIPDSAQRTIEAFEIADIHLKPINAPDKFFDNFGAGEFAIFIGPKPIRWR